MKNLKRAIQKKLHRDVIVCISEVAKHHNLFNSILIDEHTYDDLVLGLRSSIILEIPDFCTPVEMLQKSVIIAPSYELEARGKTEILALEYGTVFTIDHVIWSVNGEVEGLKDGYLLMEISEQYTITDSLVNSVFEAKELISNQSK